MVLFLLLLSFHPGGDLASSSQAHSFCLLCFLFLYKGESVLSFISVISLLVQFGFHIKIRAGSNFMYFRE